MRHPFLTSCVLIGSSLALAACGESEEEVVEIEGPSEPIEVLDGTISDDMLALDQLRSQAPLAEIVPEDGEGEQGDAPSSSRSSNANASAAVSAEPAEPEASTPSEEAAPVIAPEVTLDLPADETSTE